MSALLSHITRELLGKLKKSFKLLAPGLQLSQKDEASESIRETNYTPIILTTYGFSNPLQYFCSVSNPISPKAHDFCQEKRTLPKPPSGLTL
jgi:hypothetical protein